jgi:precorrin-6A/cobalt-precorrin-6A reductase
LHIRQHHIGVLVTKDSGKAGGVPDKLLAAQMEQCLVIAVRRPAVSGTGPRFQGLPALLHALAEVLSIPTL